MAKSCDICGKTYNKAQYVNKLRGNYNPAGIKIQRPNLQKKKIEGIKMLLCTDCIKTMVKVKRVRKYQNKSEQKS
jgi:ribosomal protein L28